MMTQEGGVSRDGNKLYASNGDGTATRVGARRIGPMLGKVECNWSTNANIQKAITKRLVEKKLPFEPCKHLRQSLIRFTDAMIEQVFSPKRIRAWAVSKGFLMENCKSGKWTHERFRSSFMKLLQEYNSRWRCTVAIKLEVVQQAGKPPRFLIADGDEGQLKALLCVCCLEDLLFEWYHNKTIKHEPVHSAMARLLSSARSDVPVGKEGEKRVPTSPEEMIGIEGDGSAWDTCCSGPLRSLTENKIMKHVSLHLDACAATPYEWHDAHARINDAEKIWLKSKPKRTGTRDAERSIFVGIDAIRRSGHRGTSVLNWLINFICWQCVLFWDPVPFVAAKARRGVTWQGQTVRKDDMFEGDDSSLFISRRIMAEKDGICLRWRSLGFHMKLKFAGVFEGCDGRVLEFVGWNCLMDAHGPMPGTAMPDPLRALKTSSWTCSQDCIDETRTETAKAISASKVGAASMAARASAFQECVPMRTYFAKLALAHLRSAPDAEFSREDKFKLRTAGQSILDTLTEVMSAPGNPQTLFTLEALGMAVEELDMVGLTAWVCEDALDTDRAMAALPRTWVARLAM